MTQKEAASFCESEQEVPAHLIEVDSQEENQAIYNEEERRKTCRGYRKTRYWMGIKKGPSGRAGDWVLESNGKSITFSNWSGKDSGDSACAIIHKDKQWMSKDCDMSGNSAMTIYYTALCELD